MKPADSLRPARFRSDSPVWFNDCARAHWNVAVRLVQFCAARCAASFAPSEHPPGLGSVNIVDQHAAESSDSKYLTDLSNKLVSALIFIYLIEAFLGLLIELGDEWHRAP